MGREPGAKITARVEAFLAAQQALRLQQGKEIRR
jgi:hypothetical protein